MVPAMNRTSKPLILGLFALCVAAAAFSWWFRFHATYHAVRFWGANGCLAIRDASQVYAIRVMELDDAANGGPVDVIGSQLDSDGTAGSKIAARSLRDSGFQAVSWCEVSGHPGLTHLRNALLQDRSFEWQQDATMEEIHWDRGLCFHDSVRSHTCVVLLSADFHYVGWLADGDGGNDAVTAGRKLATGLAAMFDEFDRLSRTDAGSAGSD